MVFVKRRAPARPKRRLKKRWYLDASIGKNVPLIGGTGLRMGSGLIKRQIRQELARQQDNKQVAGHQPYENLITHLGMDTLYVSSPVQNMVEGTSNSNRTGSEVFLRYSKVKGLLGNKSTLAEVRYRLMCVASSKPYSATTTTPQSWGGISAQFITDGLFNSGYQVLYNATINNTNSNFKVLEDKKIVIRPTISGSVKTVPFEMTCKHMKKVTYSGTTSQSVLRGWNYYFIIIPYSAGLATASEVGFVDSEYLVTFTDS